MDIKVCSSIVNPRPNINPVYNYGNYVINPLSLYPRYNMGLGDGQGSKVGILCLGGGYTQANLQTYCTTILNNQSLYDILDITEVPTTYTPPGQGPITYTNNPDFVNNPNFTGEITIDVEMIIATAPYAKIKVYFAGNEYHQAIYNGLEKALQENDFVTMSYYLATEANAKNLTIKVNGVDTNMFDAFYNLIDFYKNSCTLFVASGDRGSYDYVQGSSGLFPQTCPSAVIVGGTEIHETSTTNYEPQPYDVVWNDVEDYNLPAASGGGFSAYVATPSFQSNVKFNNLPISKRGVPDISLPNYFPFIVSTVNTAGDPGSFSIWSGTSTSSPFMAGLFANIKQALPNLDKKNILKMLYETYGSTGGYYPLVGVGNNYVSSLTNPVPSPTGPYIALDDGSQTWNPCCGLGVANGAAMIACLAVSPDFSYVQTPNTLQVVFTNTSLYGNPSLQLKNIFTFDYGDGVTGGQAYYYTYLTPDTYDVTLTSILETDAGQIEVTKTKSVIVTLPSPTDLGITISTTAYSGDPYPGVSFKCFATFGVTGTLAFGDGDSVSLTFTDGVAPVWTHTYINESNNSCVLTAYNSSGSNSSTIAVYPTASFTYTISTLPNVYTFTANPSTNVSSNYWLIEGNTYTISTVTHTFSATGDFDIVLTQANSGGTTLKTQKITVSTCAIQSLVKDVCVTGTSFPVQMFFDSSNGNYAQYNINNFTSFTRINASGTYNVPFLTNTSYGSPYTLFIQTWNAAGTVLLSEASSVFEFYKYPSCSLQTFTQKSYAYMGQQIILIPLFDVGQIQASDFSGSITGPKNFSYTLSIADSATQIPIPNDKRPSVGLATYTITVSSFGTQVTQTLVLDIVSADLILHVNKNVVTRGQSITLTPTFSLYTVNPGYSVKILDSNLNVIFPVSGTGSVVSGQNYTYTFPNTYTTPLNAVFGLVFFAPDNSVLEIFYSSSVAVVKKPVISGVTFKNTPIYDNQLSINFTPTFKEASYAYIMAGSTASTGTIVSGNLISGDPTSKFLYTFPAGTYNLFLLAVNETSILSTGSSTYPFTMTVLPSGTSPPVFITPLPLTTDVNQNSTLYLSVNVVGNPIPTLQWSMIDRHVSPSQEIILPGETGSSLNYPNAQLNISNNIFKCTATNVTNGTTNTVSTQTIVSVLFAPIISVGLNSTYNVTEGGSQSFHIEVNALPQGTINWYVDGTLSQSGASLTFILTNIPLSLNNKYVSAVVDNGILPNATTSGILLVTAAQTLPSFNTNLPATSYVPVNGTITLTVGVTGNPAPNLQWYSIIGGSTATISGETGTSLVLSSVPKTSNNYQYFCRASNTAGVVDSAITTLVVTYISFTTPLDATYVITAGNNQTFNVVVDANPAPNSYVWSLSGNILSATGPSCTITNVPIADNNKTITCTVSNSDGHGHGSSIFTSGTLNVLYPPVITKYPTDLYVNSGTTKAITFIVTGNPTNFTYLWYKDTVATAVTTATYTITNATTTDGGVYNCVVTNTTGSTNTGNCTVTITTPPTFTETLPAISTFPVGPTTFTVAATGTPTPTYQWYLNDQAIPNASSASYTRTLVTSDNTKVLKCIASNEGYDGGGTADTSTTLDVQYAPVIKPDVPKTLDFNNGDSGSISFTAVGNPNNLTYLWYKNTIATAVTTAVYTFTNIALSDAGTYYCAVSNVIDGIKNTTNTGNCVVTVYVAPTFSVGLPTTSTYSAGVTDTISVTATGTPAPTYQWFLDSVSLGITASSFSYVFSSTENGKILSCTASNKNGNFGGDVTTTTTLNILYAPVITQDVPSTLSIPVGGNSQITFTANGNPTPTYLWYKDLVSTTITTQTFTFTNAVLSDAGSYYCAVTNSKGLNNTQACVVTITTPPQFTTTLPATSTNKVGTSATFTVAVTGTPTPTLQWSLDSALISGATGTSYTINSFSKSDNQKVLRCQAQNTFGSAQTSTTLNIEYPPVFTTQPSDITLSAGQSGTLSVVVDSNPTASLLWYKNGVSTGVTTSTYKIFNAVLADNGSTFYCEATNTEYTTPVESSRATLTVTQAPNITAGLNSTYNFAAGEIAAFSITATGSSPLNYAWYLNDVLQSSTTNSISFTVTLANNNAVLKCIVSNNFTPAAVTQTTLTVWQATLTSNKQKITSGDSVILTPTFDSNGGLNTAQIFLNSANPVTVQNNVPQTFTNITVNPSVFQLAVSKIVSGSPVVISTASVTVQVIPKPVATSMVFSPTLINVGQSSTFTPTFSGGTGLITPGNITATTGITGSVNPIITTTYTLTVTNELGVTDSVVSTVNVNFNVQPLPPTQQFSILQAPYETAFTPIQPVVMQGGTPPYTYSSISTTGSGPACTLASNGVVTISASVSTTGTYTYTVNASDSASHTATQTFQLVVLAKTFDISSTVSTRFLNDYNTLTAQSKAQLVNAYAATIYQYNPNAIIYSVDVSPGSTIATGNISEPTILPTVLTLDLPNGVVITTGDNACFLNLNSILMGDRSYKKISDIVQGDLVMGYFSKKPIAVKRCGYKVVSLENVKETNHPLCIPQNHFGNNTPMTDVFISGHHRVIGINSGELIGIQAFKLGNFKTLSEKHTLELTRLDEVRYYHILLEESDAVICNGLTVETISQEDWDKVSWMEN